MDRLLDLRLEDGWGSVLGKKKPGVPFPSLDEGAASIGHYRARRL